MSERPKVLHFARNRGSSYQTSSLKHHLSLIVTVDGELVAAALCIEPEPGQYQVEIVKSDKTDSELITEMTDRCLRKMQSNKIAMARIKSEDETVAKNIWASTSWLDRIEETPPPEVAVGDDAVSCAA